MQTFSEVGILDWMCSNARRMAVRSSSYEQVAGAPLLLMVAKTVGDVDELDATTAAAPPLVRPPVAEPSV